MRGHRDLELVAIASPVCAVAALLAPWPALGLAFAAPLALFLPGYAIVAATFARRRLDLTRTLLLSVGLSLAVLALGALPLNYLGGVHGVTWAILLLLVTVNGCRIAALRRPRDSGAPAIPTLRLSRADGGLLLGGLGLAVAALILASTSLPAKEALGYTELWVVPETGPRGARVEVGIRSEEQDPLAYHLRIRIGESRVVRRSFELEPGESEIVGVRTSPSPSGRPVQVVATLLRQDLPQSVYRRVKAWLSPQEASR